MPKIKVKGQTVQTGKRPHTNGRTHTRTLLNVAPATGSIMRNNTSMHNLHVLALSRWPYAICHRLLRPTCIVGTIEDMIQQWLKLLYKLSRLLFSLLLLTSAVVWVKLSVVSISLCVCLSAGALREKGLHL